MSESNKLWRQQIDEAMAVIHHQLEQLRDGPTLGEPSDDRTVIAELEAEYQALKEARHGLGPHDRAPEGLDGNARD